MMTPPFDMSTACRSLFEDGWTPEAIQSQIVDYWVEWSTCEYTDDTGNTDDRVYSKLKALDADSDDSCMDEEDTDGKSESEYDSDSDAESEASCCGTCTHPHEHEDPYLLDEDILRYPNILKQKGMFRMDDMKKRYTRMTVQERHNVLMYAANAYSRGEVRARLYRLWKVYEDVIENTRIGNLFRADLDWATDNL